MVSAAVHAKPAPRIRLNVPPTLALLRPNQWTKNALVLAAFLFAIGDKNQNVSLSLFWSALAATACFCLVSSGVYILNDLRDAPLDRRHPKKRNRPIASGAVTPAKARIICITLLAIGLALGFCINEYLALTLGAYITLQLFYTLVLKNIAFVDVIVLATGFVLRAQAGGSAIDVTVSGWLLLCTFLLALFLALCKRRHEKIESSAMHDSHRPTLDLYPMQVLNILIAAVAATTVVCYSIYTVWPDTVAKFGTQALALTVPFVIAGVSRYLHLVYRCEKGGRPERIVLTDIPILMCLAGYGITVLCIFFL